MPAGPDVHTTGTGIRRAFVSQSIWSGLNRLMLPVPEHLLGRTIVVDSLDDAAALHREGPGGYRYVTSAGDVLEADGTLRSGPLTAAMGLHLPSIGAGSRSISRSRMWMDASSSSRAQLTDGNTVASHWKTQQNALRNEIYRDNTQKVELTSRIAQNSDKQAATASRAAACWSGRFRCCSSQTEKLATEEVGTGRRPQRDGC